MKINSDVTLGRYALEGFGISTDLITVSQTTRLNGVLDPSFSTTLFLREAETYFTYTPDHLLQIWLLFVIVTILFLLIAIGFIGVTVRQK